jgi:hypothetical protein
MNTRTLPFVSTCLIHFVRLQYQFLSNIIKSFEIPNMSNSTLTSVVEMEPLETTSLPKPISAMDDSPNDSPAAKDGQDSGHSLGDSSKDEPTPEDHFTEISHTSNTQPTLTQKDTDFLSGVLFLKHVLEWQVSGNRDITQLVSSKLLFLTLIPYLT